MQAYELSATLTSNGQLVLPDFHLDPIFHNSQIRVIILVEETSDIPDNEWLNSAAHNPAFDFLHNPEENIYSLDDGKPFEYQG
ncbi:MAG: hypothetical protein F6K42_16435 [Leptolyngbya sp. SIO1D8]|nr:hypothetical protein [Leptolyngbya sp. SIO1D8]